jgi:membrane protein required for colicin V production
LAVLGLCRGDAGVRLSYRTRNADLPNAAASEVKMPSYLDLGLIAVVFISALLSMLRGFTREVLAIASWGAAAAAAFFLYPTLLPFIKPYIQKDTIAQAVSAGIIFFITLVVVSILTVKISDAILDSKIGALDRSLGFLFGAARGFLLCAIAFLFFSWLVGDKAPPEWVQNSKTRGLLLATGLSLQSMLPENLAANLSKSIAKQRSGGDEPVADGPAPLTPNAAPAPPAPPPSAPAAGKRSEAPAPIGDGRRTQSSNVGTPNGPQSIDALLQQGTAVSR